MCGIDSIGVQTNLSYHVDPEALHSSCMGRRSIMSLEPQNADGRGEPVPGDPGCPPAALGEAWGWELIQRDWSLRAREPARPGDRVLARLAARLEVAIVRIWRLVRSALRGSARDTAR